MARYDFNVDTSPMASKLNDVTQNVNGVSGAVVAMKVAVVQAENEATDFLCNNVNEGFYQLVMSQIAQKCATANSETQAYAMELTQQAKALQLLKERMGKDFNMIAERYNSLFNSLNQALHNRVFELDKPAMNLVNKDVKYSVNRVNRLIAGVPVNQCESLVVSQRIVAGNLKNNARKLIQNMTSYLKGFNYQRYLCNRMMTEKRLDKCKRAYLPSIVSVTTSQKISRMVEVIVPKVSDTMLENNLENPLRQELARQAEGCQWQEVGTKEYEMVTGEFNRYLSDSSISDRVTEVMQKLYKQHKWQIIKEG